MSERLQNSDLTGHDLCARLVAESRIHYGGVQLICAGDSDASEKAVRIVERDREGVGDCADRHCGLVIRAVGVVHEDGLRAKLLARV